MASAKGDPLYAQLTIIFAAAAIGLGSAALMPDID